MYEYQRRKEALRRLEAEKKRELASHTMETEQKAPPPKPTSTPANTMSNGLAQKKGYMKQYRKEHHNNAYWPETKAELDSLNQAKEEYKATHDPYSLEALTGNLTNLNLESSDEDFGKAPDSSNSQKMSILTLDCTRSTQASRTPKQPTACCSLMLERA